MTDYVKQQNATQILVNGLRIYRRHFLIILLVFLPTLPFDILYDAAFGYNAPGWFKTLALGLDYFVSLLVVLLLMTVVVSDICVGNPPSLERTVRRVRVLTLYRLAVTFLLAGMIFFAAFLLNIIDLAVASISPLLFVPLAAGVGVSLYGAVMFFPSVVVLQGLWGFEAIRRSISLGRGHRLRNAGLVVALYLLPYVVYFPLIAFTKSFPVTLVVSNVVSFLLRPYVLICVVLMYYDMRKRSTPGFDKFRLAAEVGRPV